MFGEDSRLALSEFFPLAKKMKWETTLRTGIHVHLDARDLSRYQLLGLIAYYCIFEPAIYAWVGDERHSNNFCLPWYKFEGQLAQAIDILGGMRDFSKGKLTRNEDVILACESFHRYAGLNLKSLATFGSIEFRHLKTTLDYNRVRDWVNIILSLKKAALQVPQSTLAIIHAINRFGIRRTADEIFGERITEEMWKAVPDLTSKIEEHGLPAGIELIAEVQDIQENVPPQPSPLFNWYSKFEDRETTKPHPGFVMWRKKFYPKDLELKKEDLPKRLTLSEYLNMPFRPQLNLNNANDARPSEWYQIETDDEGVPLPEEPQIPADMSEEEQAFERAIQAGAHYRWPERREDESSLFDHVATRRYIKRILREQLDTAVHGGYPPVLVRNAAWVDAELRHLIEQVVGYSEFNGSYYWPFY